MTRRFAFRTLGAFAALVLASCFGDTTGPGEVRMGRFAIAPVFDTRAMRVVDVNRVRIRLLRTDGTTALDTLVDFPASDSVLSLALTVPVTTLHDVFDLYLRLIDDPAGDTVFASGPTPVTAAVAGSQPVPAEPTLYYTGPGAGATSVRFVVKPATVFFQDSVDFTAEALDANNTVIPNTPILFSVNDTTRARVPSEDQGRVVAKQVRGTVTVRAELLPTSPATPPSVTAPLVVQPVPSTIQIQSGSGQSGPVGAALPQQVVARVRAADNQGVQGVEVVFAVTAGGGTVSVQTDTTDANGDAFTTWTLGGTLGTQTLTATASGLSGGVTTATATGLVGAPRQVGFVVQPANGNAGQVLTPPIQVAAQDSFGNTVTGFTQNITIALGANPTGAALGGTVTRAAVNGVATFNDLVLDTLGAGFTLVATASGLVPDTSAAFAITGGVPTHLVITQEPGNTAAGAAITPSVTVEVRDIANNPVPAATNAVTIAIRGGTGTPGAALSGTTTVNAVAGVATFPGLSIDSAGAGYQLIVTSAGLAGDTSVAFAVSAGAPARLVVATQPPASIAAGAAFGLTVGAVDALGNAVGGYAGAVSVALQPGTGSPGAALGGTTTVNAVAGTATFAGLTLDSVGTGYRLIVTAAGLLPDTTTGVDVAAAAAAQLAITTQPPASSVAGASFGLVVTARDAVGNTATGYAGPVTVAIAAGTGTAGAALAGTVTVNAVNGVASFSGLSVDSAGTGYRLAATASGLTGATSTAFAITAGAATSLHFTTQPPAGTTAGAGFAATVTARDALGNVATGFSGNVTVAITGGTGTAGATLGGTTTVAAVSGVASFSGLSVDSAGTGFTLTATAGGVTNAVSSAFAVAAGAPVSLHFTTQPPASTTAGAGFTTVVAARDAQGNLATGFTGNVTVAITGGSGTPGATLSGTTTVAAVGGVATFGGLAVDSAGTGYTLAASASGLTATTSSAFDVAPGAATTLHVSAQPPASTTAGSGFGLAVTARDAQGNTVTGFAGSVSVAITGGTGTAGATLGGTTTVAAVGGVANFSGLTIDSAGAGYTLTASAPGVASTTTTAFAITAGAATSLQVTTQPPASSTAGAGFGLVVTARDGQGNIATGFSGNVSVAITSGTGTAGAALGGSTTVAAVAGVATFSGLAVDSVGTGYTLTASASGLTNGVTAAFAITAGAATSLHVTTQPPASSTAGAGFGLVVTARDGQGNLATGFSGNVTVAITGGTGTAGATLGGTATVAAVGGVATFSGLSVDSAGTGYTLTASASGLASGNTTAFDIAAGAATSLQVTTQPPASSTAGAAFGLVVTARDAQGNVATGFGGGVSVALAGGTAGAALSGTTTVTAAAGVATFAGLSVDSVGTGYTLAVSASGLTGTATTAFDVTAGAATVLQVTTQPPASATAGSGFGLVVTARDGQGNVATGFSGNVTVAITGGTGTAGATLGGTATVAAVGGVATFSGLSVDSAGTGYTLTASASGVSGATTTAFDITAGTAVSLHVTTEPPASSSAGAGFGLVVTARDGQGNVAAGFGGNVTVTITSGTGTTGAALIGTTTVAAVGGVATFSGLAVDSAGTGYTLTASGSGLASAVTTAFDITAGAATTLRVSTQPPSGTTAGAVFAVVVTAQDSMGNVDPAFSGNVALAITSGTGTIGAALGGTTTVTAVAGVASFSGLAIDSAGTGYTLTATASGLASAVTNAFDVSAGAPVSLRITTQPPASVTAGTGFGLTVDARDAVGNFVSGFSGSVTVAIAAGTGTAGAALGGTTTVTAVGGVATFSGLTVDSAGTGYVFDVTSAGLAPATSSSFDVAAGAASAAMTTAVVPSGVISLPTTVTITVRDAFGNVRTAANDAALLAVGVSGANSAAPTVASAGAGQYTAVYTPTQTGFDNVAITLGGTAISGSPYSSFVAASASINAWVNASGGTWSTAGNWSKGTVPTATDSVEIALAGTYTVTADVAPQFAHILLGGASGAQTLAVPGGTNLAVGAAQGVDVLASGVLSLAGGQISGAGLVSVAGAFNWSAGRLDGGGGKITVTGATNIVGGAAADTLRGYTLEIAGTGTWSGSNFINAGAGGVLRVLPGATLDVVGTNPTISQNLGSGASLDNQGTINRTTGAAGWVVNVPVTGAGAWNVTSGALDIQLGGGAGTGTISGPVTVGSGSTFLVNNGTLTLASGQTLSGAGSLTVNGGTLNVNRTVSIGNVSVTGGALVMGGTTMAVTGNFSTAGTGTLSMTNAVDSLDIAGNATFGGGSSTLSAGRIRVLGSFAQTGGATAFAATGSHRVILGSASTQNVSFASPTTSFFRRLDVPAILHNIVIQTDVQVTDSLYMRAGPSAATILGAGTTQRLTVGGVLRLDQQTSSPRIAPPVLVLSVTPTITPSAANTMNPDTAVYTGSIAALPTGLGISYKSIRVATTGTFTMAADTIANDLVVTSGTASFSGATTFLVNGGLATQGTGALSMTNSGASLTVVGNATFGGGSTTGLLTAGTLNLQGNFSEGGGSTSAFAPSGTHVTAFVRPAAAVTQTIAFADPTTSFFHGLTLNRGFFPRDTVRFLTDARVNNGMSVLNATDVVGPTARISITAGTFQMPLSTSTGTLTQVRAVEMSTTPTIGGAFAPDTTVFNGSLASLPVAAAIQYKHIRVNTLGAFTMAADTIAGDLDVTSGTPTFASAATFRIQGKLRTRLSGSFAMISSADVTVLDSAIFGGAASGNLIAGNLRLRGAFVQTGSNTFQANSGHTTVFEGTGVQTVSFATPDSAATGSHFGNVLLGSPAASGRMFLLSRVYANQLIDTTAALSDTVFSSTGDSLILNGFTLSTTVFDKTPVRVASAGVPVSGSVVTWRNMDPTVVQFAITRPGGVGTLSISNVSFQTVPTSGMYFTAANTSSLAGWTLSFPNPILPSSPPTSGQYARLLFAPVILWNGSPLP